QRRHVLRRCHRYPAIGARRGHAARMATACPLLSVTVEWDEDGLSSELPRGVSTGRVNTPARDAGGFYARRCPPSSQPLHHNTRLLDRRALDRLSQLLGHPRAAPKVCGIVRKE